KKLIYAGQDGEDATVSGNDDWGRLFAAETRGRSLLYSAVPLPEGLRGAWLDGPEGCGLVRLADGSIAEVVPARPTVPGAHQKFNLLAAAVALLDLGLP